MILTQGEAIEVSGDCSSECKSACDVEQQEHRHVVQREGHGCEHMKLFTQCSVERTF